MNNYTYIDTTEKLINFRKYLNDKNITKIAMDFEGEFNLHIYGEKLCLIQIFDGEKYFVIDPFNIADSEICKTLNNPKIIKYMYGADSDINLIYKQYGIKLRNVFDQKIFVDVLNFDKKGLDSVIHVLFGVENKLKTKFQKHNWVRRPITPAAIIYALNDVKYLFEMNDLLIKKIIDENKVNELITRIITNDFDFEKERKPKIFKEREFNRLSENNKKLFHQIYETRDVYAKMLNMPPHNVLENMLLFDIVNKKIKIDEINFNKRIPGAIVLEIRDKFGKII